MAEVIINSFFTKNGVPQTGLTPTIRIWEVTTLGYDLVIGAPNGSSIASDGSMTEILDGVSSDGFYSYTFTDVNGYDPTKTYLFRSDGGATLKAGERYQVSSTDPTQDIAELSGSVADAVWEEPASWHTNSDTMGLLENQISANTSSIAISMTNAISLIETLLQYQTNRTKLDKANKTLTIYDDLGTTAIKIFDLKDSSGNPSITEICERVPRSTP